MKMPFRKKSSPSMSQKAPEAKQEKRGKSGKKNVWDTGWQQAEPDEGMPGTSGYFRGIKGESHPSRFVYKRPDGKEEDEAREVDPDAPMSPSRRPVPRGFFS